MTALSIIGLIVAIGLASFGLTILAMLAYANGWQR